MNEVASFTDAWIETDLPVSGKRRFWVASFTDAWIETAVWRAEVPSILSHLLQMRGLKRSIRWRSFGIFRRIFYRCVDWNTYAACKIFTFQVASFTDAWIETLWCFKYAWVPWVASFTDAWIETYFLGMIRVMDLSHLLQMRGLKPWDEENEENEDSRIFYRCVDWNKRGIT